MLILSSSHITAMHNHGREAYPEECCGALLGIIEGELGGKRIVDLLPLHNASQENKARRFAITADDYAMLEREAAQRGLSLLGFYHTHPDHPAQPSATDLAYAWPLFSYVILEMRQGEPAACNSFELDLDLDPDTKAFKAEELRVTTAL